MNQQTNGNPVQETPYHRPYPPVHPPVLIGDPKNQDALDRIYEKKMAEYSVDYYQKLYNFILSSIKYYLKSYPDVIRRGRHFYFLHEVEDAYRLLKKVDNEDWKKRNSEDWQKAWIVDFNKTLVEVDLDNVYRSYPWVFLVASQIKSAEEMIEHLGYPPECFLTDLWMDVGFFVENEFTKDDNAGEDVPDEHT